MTDEVQRTKAPVGRHLRAVDSGAPGQVAWARKRGFVPIEGRMQRPRLREGLVLRGELVDVLREQSDHPVVLVTGPPGYGKTTLLAQWDAEDERAFTWLTLDASSNDPTVLATYLLLALQRVGIVDVGVLGALAEQSAVPTVLLPRLGRMVSQTATPFVLVVDDAETVTSPEALEVLSVVATHLRQGSQLAIAARASPALPWSRLRAQRRLVAFGPNDLRLSPTEARAVLTSLGVEVSADELAALLERTEGWPAGVYLAALSLHGAAERQRAVPLFGGHGSVVQRYLRDDVLTALPPEQRDFLVRTSMLTRMSAPLCDAMLGVNESGQLLRDLERSSLFVVPLDDNEEWYRYHHLFAEMLRAELAGVDRTVVTALHARASRWLEAAGDLEEAVRHAQAANEVERAAELVWSQAAPYLASGREKTLRRWLDAFPTDTVMQHARLALTAAWCAVERGAPVDHWIAAAEHGVFDATREGVADSVESSVALLRAQRAREGVRQMRVEAERAEQLLPPEDQWRPFAGYLVATAVLLEGDTDDARRRFEATARLAGALQTPRTRALCIAQLAAIAIETGDWDRAAASAEGAFGVLADNATPDGPTVTLVPCVLTVVRAKQGRADEAKRLTHQTTRVIAAHDQIPAWLAVQLRYLIARTHILLGDSAAARVVLSEAQTLMRATDDATWLRDRLDGAWAQVEQFPLATGVGPSALTTAELRVLQLLPTHLSFEEIGKRLSVSRNTVKTEAIAAYRKLGVSSRAEAVARAASLGMIQL